MRNYTENGGHPIRIIANPIAGYGMTKIITPLIIQKMNKLNLNYKLFYPASSSKIGCYLKNLTDNEIVCFVGGDGTLHEIVNNLQNFNNFICAFPTGTGNAYAKELFLPRSIDQMLRIIRQASFVEWDVGYDKNSRFKFALFCGAGFHSQVIKLFQLNRRGTTLITSYLKWGHYCMKRECLPKLKVIIDGKEISNDSCWVEAFNVSHYGGPLRLAPHANPSDGLFDIMIMRGKTKRDILRLLAEGFIKYLGFEDYRIRDIEFYKGKNVEISSNENVPFHMDGDCKGHLPVDLSLHTAKLKFLCQN